MLLDRFSEICSFFFLFPMGWHLHTVPTLYLPIARRYRTGELSGAAGSTGPEQVLEIDDIRGTSRKRWERALVLIFSLPGDGGHFKTISINTSIRR